MNKEFYEVFFVVMFYYMSYSSMINLEWIIQRIYLEILGNKSILVLYLQQIAFSCFFVFSLLIYWINSVVSIHYLKVNVRVIISIVLMMFCQLMLFVFMTFKDYAFIQGLILSDWALVLLFLVYILGGISSSLFQSNIFFISNAFGDRTRFLSVVSISPGLFTLNIFGCLLAEKIPIFVIYLLCFLFLLASLIIFLTRMNTKFTQIPTDLLDKLFKMTQDNTSIERINIFDPITTNTISVNSSDDDGENNFFTYDNYLDTIYGNTAIARFKVKITLTFQHLYVHFMASFLDGFLMTLFSQRTISYLYTPSFISLRLFLIIYNLFTFVGLVCSKTLIYLIPYQQNLIFIVFLIQFLFVLFFLMSALTIASGLILSISTGIIYMNTLERISRKIQSVDHVFAYSIWLSFIVIGMIIGTNLDIVVANVIKKIY